MPSARVKAEQTHEGINLYVGQEKGFGYRMKKGSELIFWPFTHVICTDTCLSCIKTCHKLMLESAKHLCSSPHSTLMDYRQMEIS